VRLGVEHPKGVTVHRREVYEAIRQDGACTSQPDAS
jgi:sRNA-binding carbon storage regulator CsrA